jgi:putative hydrolase of HD superfamily
VELKAENPIGLLKDKSAPPVIAAYFELCHLKQLYRQGWLRRGVPRERCESVAEHSFGVAVLTLWLANSVEAPLDVCKVAQMALLHDVGEVYAGDITPADAVSAEEKSLLEAEAVRQIFLRLPEGETYLSVWEEYEAGETPEARFVRQIDRLEMALQASVYRHQGMLGMEEFFETTRRALSDPALLRLLEEIA